MTPTELQLLAEIRTLSRGPFTDRAARLDREGALSAENMSALKELGIPGMGLPVERGGLGVSPEARTRIMEELAYGDGSTAVAINMHVLNTDALVFAPSFAHRDTVLDDIAKNGSLMCFPGSVPLAELDTRPAGFRFVDTGDQLVANGKSGFGTMSDAASYVMAVGALEGIDGEDAQIVLALPKIDAPGVKVMGNWDAMGLRATASHDVSFTDVLIPKSQALITSPAEYRAASARSTGPTNTQDHRAGVLGLLGIWLGLARAAFDFTVEYSSKRYGFNAVPGAKITNEGMRSDQAWAQIEIGHMDHWIGTGDALLYDFIAKLSTQRDRAEDFTQELTRLTYHLRRMSEEVAQASMRVCGAHAYVKGRALERIFRDIVGGNVMALKTEQMAQSLGKGALGMEISFSGPAGS
ncbi:acyl-CoA dehydrogenase [Rhodococcus sp. KBS0724]|uniref:acyl-CoA dehydrogenase family protein n=1 Tax=Rhodococcus sp. KBS0724 TaxID=1179674 RepID=UPI00110F5AE8|nr:acyl-CoA dehydrogenase family protein [Rhodococcus sp. KBS0724]TSD40307.1 acyl-CoA dehydrogenase [Rhodococcus sp. KBS0724]